MSIRLLLAVVLFVPSMALSQTKYTVREGDTLLKIADRTLENTDRKNPRRYDFVKNLVKLNPALKSPNALAPGQTILLPTREPQPKKIVVEAAPVADAPVATVAPTVKSEVPEPEDAHNAASAAVPAIEAKPETPVEESHSAAHRNFFFVQPRYQIIDLTSKDEAAGTKAKMKSKNSFGLDLQYGIILSERFHWLFQTGVTATQFGDLEGVVGEVNHKMETSKSYSTGVGYQATPSLEIELMAFYAEHTFLLPPTVTDYELEAIAIPGLELNFSWDFYAKGSNILGVSAAGEFLDKVKKGEVEYKSVFEPFGALYWKSSFGEDRTNYKVTLTYKQSHQKTSVAEKIEDVTMLGVGFYF